MGEACRCQWNLHAPQRSEGGHGPCPRMPLALVSDASHRAKKPLTSAARVFDAAHQVVVKGDTSFAQASDNDLSMVEDHQGFNRQGQSAPSRSFLTRKAPRRSTAARGERRKGNVEERGIWS